MFVPNKAKTRCHLRPSPASALAGSSSTALTPYCWIQHVKALFLGFSIPCSLSFPMDFSGQSFDGLDTGSSFSESLSTSGCCPIFCGRDLVDNSKEDGGGLWTFLDRNRRSSDFCSSRSPHSLKSCSLRRANRSESFRRLRQVSIILAKQ